MPAYMQRLRFAPLPELERMRDREGVESVRTPFGSTAWLVTRHADVREVLGDTEHFSNQVRRPDGTPGEAPGGLPLMPGFLLSYDPPEHTRLRRVLTREFTAKRMRRLEPRIHELVDEHLDAMQEAGPPADLVTEFALPVPSLVICELLGVPSGDRAAFQERTGTMLDVGRGEQARTAAAAASRVYMSELVTRARREPGEDMIGMLVREHGDDITHAELVGVATLLLIGGHETTSNMLGLGTLALLEHPDQLAVVRDDPAAVDTAIEELLRWLSVVHASVPRMATVDTTVGGHRVRAGDLVVCSITVADRDPELGEDADRLDVTRRAASHLAFGHGVHHCLGAPLARMEMRIGFPALLRRFPGLRLAVPDEDIDFRSSHLVYGLNALPVEW
nr:cytochrome P450 [Pseudonocardia acidicola]